MSASFGRVSELRVAGHVKAACIMVTQQRQQKMRGSVVAESDETYPMRSGRWDRGRWNVLDETFELLGVELVPATVFEEQCPRSEADDSSAPSGGCYARRQAQAELKRMAMRGDGLVKPAGVLQALARFDALRRDQA